MDRFTARLTSRLLSFGLPLLYLLTSISFYLHTYDSAQVKITIVQMCGAVVVTFWYLTLACEDKRSLKSYLPIAAPLLAALISGLISWCHTPYRGPGIDETLRRFFYIHFALIAFKEINTMERLRRVVKYLLIATAIATIYGFIQFIDTKFFYGMPGVDPFVWRQAFGSRIFSTFGNPNFYGNFLVILTPITLALLLRRHSDQPGSLLVFAMSTIVVSALLWHGDLVLALVKLGSWHSAFFTILFAGFTFFAIYRYSFLGLLFFLITLTNIVTESKGAWIGFAASFISFLILVLFFFSQFRSEKVKRAIQQAVMLTLVACVVAVGIYSRRRTDSIRFRIATWVSTWEMGQMNPIFGNGVGSFRVLYPAFRRPQIFHIEGKHNTETDHAENEYWEVFQDEGLIGFGIFIWVITTFSMLGMRGLRRFTEGISVRDPVTGKRKMSNDPRAFYMLGFLAAFWGMLMHNFMDVSLRFVSSGIFLWLLAGLIGALVYHDPLFETDEQRFAREQEKVQEPGAQGPLQLAASAITAVLFGWLTYKVFVEFNDVQGSTPGPFGELLLWLIAWVAFVATVGVVLWAIYKTVRSLRFAPGFIILWLMVPALNTFWGYFMADAFHNRGIYFSKQQSWDQALANYRKVVDLNPNYLMAYYFMGNVYTDRWQGDDVDSAIHEYENVWKIAPNYVQSHHQAGLVFLKRGQDDRKRFEELRAQVIANPGNVALRQQAEQMLARTKQDWDRSLMYFHHYHGLDPVFEPNYARAAYVHMQLAELAAMEGNGAEVVRNQKKAQEMYEESLNATVCGWSSNDVLRERWSQNHRHFTGEMFENLGNTRFVSGQYASAAKAYRMAIWRDKDNIHARKNLAAVYGRLGRNAEVNTIWNEIRQLAPQDPDVQRVFSHATTVPPRS